MIRLACAQPVYRPAVTVPVVSAAAVLGVLAEPSVLFATSCLLYVAAAVQHSGTRPGDLATLSYLGWPGGSILALVLTEALLYGAAAGLCAAAFAALLPAVATGAAGTAGAVGATGAVGAACVAFLLPLAAGAVRAVRLPAVVRAAPAAPEIGARSQEAR